jgi:hypothetical protein
MIESPLEERRQRGAGRNGVQPDAASGPAGERRGSANPAGQRQLPRRVRERSAYLGRVAAGLGLVAGAARGGDRPVRARADGGRVRRHRDRGGGSSRGQRGREALEQRDGAEVVHRHDGTRVVVLRPQTRARHDTIEGAAAGLEHARNRPGTPGGRRQVGRHVGVPHVHADHPVTVAPEPLQQRATDSRCRPAQRDHAPFAHRR